MNPSERIVILGAGTAGARLAQQLQGCHDTAEVTVIGEEPHQPYNRVLLGEVLAGTYGPEVIRLPAPEVRLGTRAVRIDRAQREVQCDDGRALPYDRLVLATGSNPVLPPLRGLFPGNGHELPAGVHPFRTLDDAEALRTAAGPGTAAVVMGGGLLGVTAARALARRGAQVVLAHQGEHLMERHLDAMAAAHVRRHLEELGVEVHTECRVRGVHTEQRTVRSVELADGYRLDADLLVLACGVRPRIGLAQAAGLKTDRGIIVDDALRTSDPAIHAIGDCAQHRGTVYGLAGAALEQADLLARSVRGETMPRYDGTRALTRLTLAAAAPLDLAAFGDPVPRDHDDDVVQLADATRGIYRKVVVRDGRLTGGILLGDLAAVGALARAWEGDEALPDSATAPLLHLLTHTDGGS